MKDKINNPRIEFTNLFNRQRKESPLLIKIAFREAFELFLHDPRHPALRNHQLQGKFAGYRSIDITDDWRAMYKEIRSGETIVIYFSALGTHKQLYASSR